MNARLVQRHEARTGERSLTRGERSATWFEWSGAGTGEVDYAYFFEPAIFLSGLLVRRTRIDGRCRASRLLCGLVK